MPVSDLHSTCLRCLGEGHISDKCQIGKSFKPRTEKDREIRLKVLTLALEQRSDSASSTTASLRSALPVLSTSQHRSPSMAPAKKLKKAGRGRSPTPHKGKGRAGGELRPTLGGSSAPSEVGPQLLSSDAAHPVPCPEARTQRRAFISFGCRRCLKRSRLHRRP